MQLPQLQKPQSAAGVFGVSYAMACVLFLPLYMQNGYVDLITGKYQILLALAAIGVVGAVGMKVLGKLSLPRNFFRNGSLWVLLLCSSYAIGAVFSENQHTALWGFYGRQNGLSTFLCCAALFFVVRAFESEGLGWAVQQTVCLTGGVVALLGWLNYWNIDPFGVYYSMPQSSGHMFLSTIGNINFFGGFLCLCTPLVVQKAMETKTAFHLGAAVLMISAFVPANSDGAWIGIIVCLLVALCSKAMNGQMFAQLCKLAGLSCGIWVVNALRSLFFPTKGQLRTMSAVVGKLPASVLLMGLFFGLLYLGKKRQLPVRKIGFALAAAVAAGVAAGILLANFTAISLGGLDNLFKLDKTWGSNRGYVWYILMLVYGRFGWLQKLFGAGADTVYSLLNPHYTEYIVALNGSTFDSAHNEFLQHLVCGGVVGLIAWCGFLGGRIKATAQSNPALSLGLMGYAVQSFFSISMPAVLPLVFVFAALPPNQSKQKQGDSAWAVIGAAAIGVAAIGISAFLK